MNGLGKSWVNCIFLHGRPSMQRNKPPSNLYYLPRTSSGVRLLNYSSPSERKIQVTQVVTLQWDLLLGTIMPREPEKNDYGLYSTWAKSTRRGFSFWELGDRAASRAHVTAQGQESKCEVCTTSVECGRNTGRGRHERRWDWKGRHGAVCEIPCSTC